MKQARLTDVKKIVYEEVPMPQLADDEVMIQVKACGICGSDIHAFLGEHPMMPPPLVLGHEFSGIISETGADVSDFEIGQRVTVEPLLVCGQCKKCLSGRYNTCEQLKVMGCQSRGAYADYIPVPAAKVVPLPEDVSFIDGGLVEPAAVGHHASRRACLKGGEKILLFGVGPIGLFTLQMLKAYGAGEITCLDFSSQRLALAKRLGADHVAKPEKQVLDELKSLKEKGEEFDLIVDCVGGSGKALDVALDIAAKGSRILAVGILEKNITLENLTWISEHELELTSSFTYTKEDFEKTVELMGKGTVDTSGIASHTFPMSHAAEAFDFIENPSEEFIKIVLLND